MPKQASKPGLKKTNTTSAYVGFKALLPFVLIATTACSFVELAPGAKQVILSDDLESCQRIGETRVTVIDKVLLMDRSEETIADELQTLAQNAAVDMGGNAIWPISPVENGSRRFRIMQCAPR